MAQTTLRDYLQTTEDAISSGRVNDALANCQYILTYFPESLEGQRLLGEVYLAQGNLDEAQQTFDWVLTNDPENVIAYCDRALICEQLTDYDTALDCYQQAYELSRGNGQIRQEFNQLSQKVGQPGFIFSRAGLARLYMRGDLLTQAIQEWETVLDSTPERLDARTGLLEALWREGLYDRVEELAAQILDDVPNCLKAILLLAHVTFAQNALRAQELMRHVEMLDPDLVMAHDLFSDFMVSQPKDPFLKLLKKSPTVFPKTSNGNQMEIAGADTLKVPAESDRTNGTATASTFIDPLVKWSSVDNIIAPHQDYQTLADASPFGSWGNNSSSDFGSWSTFGQQEQQLAQAMPTTNAAQSAQSRDNTPEPGPWDPFAKTSDTLVREEAQPEPEAWQMLSDDSESDDTVVTHEEVGLQEQQPWYHMDTFVELSADSWGSVNNLNPISSAASWEAEEQASDLPTPPAWLDMLTRSDYRQSSGAIPKQQATSPSIEQEASTVKPAAQEPAEAAPVIEVPWDEEDYTMAASSQQEEEEPFFFGPEWLKSLGATALDSAMPSEPDLTITMPGETARSVVSEPSARETPSVVSDSTAAWMPPGDSEPAPTQEAPELRDARDPEKPAAESAVSETKPKITIENWLEQAAQRLNQPEQNILTTLEELENDLRSQGFRPMEPGTLSSIVQEPSLSSALEQLGNFAPQPGNEVQTPQPSTIASVPPAGPLWPAIPGPLSQTDPQPVVNKSPERGHASSSHLDASSSFVSNTVPNPSGSTSPEPVRADAFSSLTSNSVPSPSFNVQQAPAQAQNVRPDALPEFELETTMKRPAVRLQPMQQWTSSSTQPNQPASRGRAGERSTVGRAADGSLNYKERLLKGYQNQLAGAYDDAMQEYRIIIRNAPDLLGEVVSNMRALLKIAPKYSTGYRVLGDAYMRQGEYLQAMEAYNKALTMAKKAKS